MVMADAAKLPVLLKSPISPTDYPRAAFRNNEQGSVLIDLLVKPDGSVERCEVIISSKSKPLDSATCIRFMRAKFRPSQDKSGTPVYGSIKKWASWSVGGPIGLPISMDVVLTVNRLPADINKMPYSVVNVVLDSLGKVESCDLNISSGIPSLDAAACSLGIDSASIKPITNSNGSIVRAVTTLNVGFSASNPQGLQWKPVGNGN